MGTFRRRRHRGFTLMELLVTIAIVILIAGIVIASMPGVLRAMKRQETRSLITRIEEGLNAFHDDHGYFPIHPDPAVPGPGVYRDEIAREGAVVLYQALSGDFDLDGKADPGAIPLVDELPSTATKGGRAAVDPFGAPLRYLAAKPNVPSREKRTRNHDYDLWSLGGARDSDDAASWITR